MGSTSSTLLQQRKAAADKESGRACEGVLAAAVAMLGKAMPLRGISLFGSAGASPRWFSSPGSGTSSNAIENSGKCICGMAVVRGNLEEWRLEQLKEELGHALGTILQPAAGPDVRVVVYSGKRASRVDLGGWEAPQVCAEFAFEVWLDDANDRQPVLELLRLEAHCGGARGLMPLLANSPEAAGHLALRLELEATC